MRSLKILRPDRSSLPGLLLAVLALSPWAASAAPTPDSPTLQRIRDTGVIVLGYRATSPPFSYLDSRLKPIGYSIELCERVIQAVRKQLALDELEVKRVPVSSATRMPLVANGTLDLECGVTTHTAERARNQAFSVTTFVAETKLLSRRSSAPLQEVEDLRGKVVVSTIGTTSIQHLHAVNSRQGLDMRILLGQDDQEAFRILQSGRAQAFMMDDVLLASLVAEAPDGAEYRMSTQALTVEPYAIGLPPRDPGFKRLVDAELAALYRSGEIQTIYRRWFESPIPPKGVNLRLPMSPAFQRVVKQPIDSPDPTQYQ